MDVEQGAYTTWNTRMLAQVLHGCSSVYCVLMDRTQGR